MVVKNTSGKIISFGATAVLPKETATVGDEYAGTAAMNAFVRMGFVEIIEPEKPKTEKGKTKKTVEEPVAES